MKILFAVSNENISAAIKREYQNNYKGMLTTKNVYYFNAIIKELQIDKSYDVLIVSEDLEPFANTNYDAIDKFVIGKLTDIKQESKKIDGSIIPIIFITTDRHTLGDNLLSRLYEIGIYNALFGENRSIQKVCDLIEKPRDKDSAKRDYKIINDYQAEEKDDYVKEAEIKNIIAHYKKLGKSEEKYVESFDNIASQYSDAQLKVIIKFLPLNVKAVLEEQSRKYQELMTFGQNYKRPVAVPKEINKIKEQEKKLETKTDMLLEQLSDIKPDSQIIIPKAINSSIARKATSIQQEELVNQTNDNPVLPGFDIDEEDDENFEVNPIDEVITENDVETTVKRGRGRPKKFKPEEEISDVVSTEPKRRGRPRKLPLPDENLESIEEVQEDANLFGLFADHEEVHEVRTPESNRNQDNLNYETQNGQNNFNNPYGVQNGQNSFNNQKENFFNNNEHEINNNISESYPSIERENKNGYNYDNIESLVSRDRKIVSFVGTSKNGTSFIVNNIAQVLSGMNVSTAILDMTRNKNSYYIYTQNDEGLREKASMSIEGLKDGIAEGIVVNKNLTIYTSTPTDKNKYEEADFILRTLIQKYSLVLIDCDFDTPFGYFDNSQEIYIVQSMDILTIQPLTAFLRDLKAKDILKQEKIRVIINKAEKVKGLNEKVLVGGIAYYNDPSMSFMTELFDKNNVKTAVIPFDVQVYIKYLGTLVDCDLSLNGYPKQFMSSLRNLANMIYPLLSNNKTNKYTPPSINNFNNNNNPFSNQMDNTLNQMRNNRF